MKPAKAVFVSRFEPKAVGHGGDHRAYQVLHDLQQVVGTDNVIVVSLSRWQQASSPEQTRGPASRPERRILTPRIKFKLGRLLPSVHVGGRVALLVRARGATDLYLTVKFIDYYEQVVRDMPRPAVCVMDHIGFEPLLALNSGYRIPTVGCIQNIEAFDRAVLASQGQKGKAYGAAIEFAEEVSVLARCDARLFISKVETGLIGGLGLPCLYYPYQPVGEIRQNLMRIRQSRAKGRVTPGLFLMLGSGAHKTTWDSFAWFVQNVANHGLPSGTRVVVGGSKTDRLLPPGVSAAGLELRGWLPQAELDDLLTRAEAVLIPQQVGFGGLTRLPELACAGVPVVASGHPTYAIDPTPGLHVVDDTWDAWARTMEQLTGMETCVAEDEYRAWEERQPTSLETVLEVLQQCNQLG